MFSMDDGRIRRFWEGFGGDVGEFGEIEDSGGVWCGLEGRIGVW